MTLKRPHQLRYTVWSSVQQTGTTHSLSWQRLLSNFQAAQKLDCWKTKFLLKVTSRRSSACLLLCWSWSFLPWWYRRSIGLVRSWIALASMYSWWWELGWLYCLWLGCKGLGDHKRRPKCHAQQVFCKGQLSRGPRCTPIQWWDWRSREISKIQSLQVSLYNSRDYFSQR
jgi:hypothetical protein